MWASYARAESLLQLQYETGRGIVSDTLSRGGAVVARKAHNLEVAGAIPAPATIRKEGAFGRFLFVYCARGEKRLRASRQQDVLTNTILCAKMCPV